jgi:carbonic anhydrase
MYKFLIALLLLGKLGAFESTMAPDASLKKLLEGNNRFINDKSICPQRNEERRLALVSKQSPFAVIVGCSDSRVPPDLIFDQGVGDLFVVRVAGNVIGDIEMDSIEFAVTQLHASLILILGHANCGAVTAVLSGETAGIAALARKIEPAIKGIKPNETGAIEKAIKANIQNGVQTVLHSSALKPLVEQNKIRVVGGYYNLESGKVDILQ